jgi:hypothetical protein
MRVDFLPPPPFLLLILYLVDLKTFLVGPQLSQSRQNQLNHIAKVDNLLYPPTLTWP